MKEAMSAILSVMLEVEKNIHILRGYISERSRLRLPVAEEERKALQSLVYCYTELPYYRIPCCFIGDDGPLCYKTEVVPAEYDKFLGNKKPLYLPAYWVKAPCCASYFCEEHAQQASHDQDPALDKDNGDNHCWEHGDLVTDPTPYPPSYLQLPHSRCDVLEE